MKIEIDFNKFFIFVSKIFNYLFIKPKTLIIMNPLQEVSNNYFAATDLQPTLDNAVLTAQANLKPFKDILDAAVKAQNDNITLTGDLKKQIINGLLPEMNPENVTPVVPAPETDIPV
jgi:hypothetical protein